MPRVHTMAVCPQSFECLVIVIFLDSCLDLIHSFSGFMLTLNVKKDKRKSSVHAFLQMVKGVAGKRDEAQTILCQQNNFTKLLRNLRESSYCSSF